MFCGCDRLFPSYKAETLSVYRTIGKNEIPGAVLQRYEQYEKTENISQTLDLLLEQYPKGKVAKRLRASKDYLKNSHYKDYETALYRYLSDSDTANVITELLLKDLQKICRIPCKQEKNTGEENKNEKK